MELRLRESSLARGVWHCVLPFRVELGGWWWWLLERERERDGGREESVKVRTGEINVKLLRVYWELTPRRRISSEKGLLAKSSMFCRSTAKDEERERKETKSSDEGTKK